MVGAASVAVMNPFAALGVLVGLIALTAAGGMLWRARWGRVRRAEGTTRITPADVGAAAFGSTITLLQFSTAFCAPCRSTARVLGALAEATEGVVHVEVDLAESPELARRYGILQTPTTFILDRSGSVRARVTGAARPDQVRSTVADIIGSPHVSA